jgi:hypothetical protein
MSAGGTWDVVLARLLTAAEDAGIVDWSVAVDSTIARAHRACQMVCGRELRLTEVTVVASGRNRNDNVAVDWHE